MLGLGAQDGEAVGGGVHVGQPRRTLVRNALASGDPGIIGSVSVQFYETTVVDPASGSAASFITVPARSLPRAQAPPIKWVAVHLGLERFTLMQRVEAWTLPFLMDGLLGRFPLDYVEGHLELPRHMWGESAPWLGPRGPTPFAQELTFAPVVPFEASPLGGKAIAEIVTAAGGSAGGAVGFAATGEPLLLIVVPAGIVLCGAATTLVKIMDRAGDVLAEELMDRGLRAKLRALLTGEDPKAANREEEVSSHPPPPPGGV